MSLLVVLIFVAIFAVIAPVLVMWSGAGKAAEKKQVIAALDSALGDTKKDRRAPVVDFRKTEIFSTIPWLHKILARVDLIPRLQKILNQAEVKSTPGALVLMSLACLAGPGYLVELRTGSVILGLLIGAALGFLPLSYVLIKRGKRFKKFEAGLPDALDLMTSALRVGHSFNSALSLVSRECADPIGSEFRAAFDEQNFGLELRVALENLIARIPLQDLKIVVTAILIQRESGGNLAEVLEKTAYVIRQRFRLKRQVMTHTAQGRLTGWILTILPVALGIGLYIINPDTESLLWHREIGVKLLFAGAGMMVIGTLIIQKIVRMDV
ncbi:MAG TPA: type II secretion system F family protein [Terracidiphilus sp.]|jgi:tight adherence protein B